MKRSFFFALAFGFLSAVYFFWPRQAHYGASFSVSFLPEGGLPLLDVQIEKMVYPLVLDLGSSGFFVLSPTVLSSVKKEMLYSHVCFDVQGNSCPSTAYRLPKLQIHNMTFSEVVVWDEEDDFLQKGSILYRENPEAPRPVRYGRIGRDAFIQGKANLLLDFANEKVYVACHLEDLKKKGYEKRDFFSVPIEIDPEVGIILRVEMDLGEKRFLLDTGSTRSLVQASSVDLSLCREWKRGIFIFSSSTFCIEGHDFGVWDFFLFPMVGAFERVDGFLGMDFFRERVVFLDFSQKMAYISRNCSQKRCGTTQES